MYRSTSPASSLLWHPLIALAALAVFLTAPAQAQWYHGGGGGGWGGGGWHGGYGGYHGSAGYYNGPHGSVGYYHGGGGWNGYRTGFYYRGGTYCAANINVGGFYAAPIGVYSGWNVMAQPYYVSYPMFATYPVEVAVQVELQKRGFFNGQVDGVIGPVTSNAIANYQQSNGLVPTGNINHALLVSLGIENA